ncbi:MAG: cytochrome P450 [Myxococcales bacterium]|nr:cytochrome P450 [Myxococcales bacterium]
MTESGYDPFDPAVIGDPYPHYRWLREQAPCHYNAERDIYVLSRYADVRAALSNFELFSSTEGVGYERRPVPMMIAYDPPEHTRLRRIVAGRFTPRALAQWHERIEAIAADMVARAVEAGEVDLVEALAGPFPVQVIAEMMDIPMERRADFKRWSDNTVEALGGAVDASPEERAKVEMTIMEFAMYFAEVLRERRPEAADRDDLISLLIRPSDDGEALADHEIISFCVLLLVAGNETTTNLISNTAHHLMRLPDHWQRVVEDPSLIGPLIEEGLRYDAPIQGFFRNTLAETTVAGVTIPRGAKVFLLYGAANRDPAQFPEPDRFRVERNPLEHIAFGFGPHTCLGAHLARLEARILTRHMLERVTCMKPAGEAVRTQNPLLRGMESLPVKIS